MTATYTNEQLVSMIQNGENTDFAYEQLFVNLRPVILSEAKMYQGKMPIYDREDLIQEGHITIWKATGTFKSGNFQSYFASAIKRHYISLYRDYTLKNLICIAETEDFRGYGYTTQTLVISNYATAYREKHREECRRSNAKRKAEKEAERIALGLPKPGPKPRKPRQSKYTEEEKRLRNLESSKRYNEAHKEELSRKRKERYAAKKAAMAAAAAAATA